MEEPGGADEAGLCLRLGVPREAGEVSVWPGLEEPRRADGKMLGAPGRIGVTTKSPGLEVLERADEVSACVELEVPGGVDTGKVYPRLGVRGGPDGETVCLRLGLSAGADGKMVCPGLGLPRLSDSGNLHPGLRLPGEENAGKVCPGLEVPGEANAGKVCPGLRVPREADASKVSPGLGVPREADASKVSPGLGVPREADASKVSPGLGVPREADASKVSPGLGVPREADASKVSPGLGVPREADANKVSPGLGVLGGTEAGKVCPGLGARIMTSHKSVQADPRVRSKRRGVSGEKEGPLRQTVGGDFPDSGRLERKETASKGERNQSKGDKEKRSVQKKTESRALRRLVTVDSSKAKTSLEAVRISIKQLHWKEFPLGRRLPCDIYWHGVSFHESDNICSGQVNKFPGMTEMVRKINLSRAVRTMQELFPDEYDFYPQSWILPEEYPIFTAQVRIAKESNPLWKPTFIVKPDGGCQGDGIYLIKDPSEVRIMASVQNRPAVVQEYISKPLLMDKLKFDMRLYVLLRSLEPLEIYIAKDGLSRFCTEPYQEPTHKNLHRVYMHLTNYSLNIHSGNFIHSDNVHTGSKRTFSSILYRLSAKGVDVRKVWSDIISLVIKTIIALVPELKVYFQVDIPASKPGPTCFQILGFDILLMKNLKPILLEVNANPSMKIEHEQELLPGIFENVPSFVDEEVKIAVIRDTLRLVDPQQRQSLSPHHLDSSVTTMSDLNMGSEDMLQPDNEKSLENNLPSLCLKQVFPKYSKQFNYLRVVERIATLFIRFQGIRGTMKMGPTGFRTFIRSCKLCSGSFSMASGDILYIDITRRWNSMALDQRESGMCLQAFIEAFFYLAQRRFKGLQLHEQVQALADLCHSQVSTAEEKRILCSRGALECRTALSNYRHTNVRLTSYTALSHRTNTSCKLSDYKLQHS